MFTYSVTSCSIVDVHIHIFQLTLQNKEHSQAYAIVPKNYMLPFRVGEIDIH